MTDLLGKSTVKRRKAAIALRKQSESSEDDCLILFDALKLEEDSKYWQTQFEVIKTLGLLNCKAATGYIYKHYIEKAEEHSAVARAAATAYVRLMRKDINDASVVIELLQKSIYSVSEGALEPLGYDKMCPDISTQDKIIDLCFTFGHDRSKGYTDPRYGLAAACAGWESSKVKPFLEECLKAKDVPLNYVAKHALNRKYVRLR